MVGAASASQPRCAVVDHSARRARISASIETRETGITYFGVVGRAISAGCCRAGRTGTRVCLANVTAGVKASVARTARLVAVAGASQTRSAVVDRSAC